MRFSVQAISAVLLLQTASYHSFQISPSPPHRRSVQLNSLLDDAYDLPSIAGTYSRSAEGASVAVKQVAEVAIKEAPKVAKVAAKVKGIPKPQVAEVAASVQTATTEASKVAASVQTATTEASTKAAASLQAVTTEASTKVAASLQTVTTEASKQASSAVDEFVRAANENLPAVKTTVSAGISTGVNGFQHMTSPLANHVFTPSTPLEPGKTRPMADYFADAFKNAGSWSVEVPSGESVADTKSKFALMVSNTYALLGLDSPSTVPAIPDNAAGWIAAAFATAIALNQRSSGIADAQVAMGDMVQKEAAAVSEIADQLKSMGDEIKKLNEETQALSRELQAAKTELSAKELALSKERVAAADKEVQLNKRIDELKTTLKDAHDRLTLIDDAIRVEDSSPVAQVAKKAAPKRATKGSVKKVRVVKKATKGEKKETTEKKAPAPKKKAAAKKTTAKKKEVSWSSLSESTLSRKTIKQLSEYLTQMGVSTTGDDGKTLKKASLVEAVQSL